MSGNKILVDTNILIYTLEGKDFIKPYLDFEIWISEITEIELLGYQGISASEIKTIKQLLKDCYILDFNNEIKETTIKLKQTNKIKVPDAIIAASSIYLNCPLLTVDKALQKIPDLNLIKLNLPKVI